MKQNPLKSTQLLTKLEPRKDTGKMKSSYFLLVGSCCSFSLVDDIKVK